MALPFDGPGPSHLSRRMLFVVSAAAAALALRIAWQAPAAGAIGLVFLLTMLAARWLLRQRARKLLRSGNVESVLERWSSALARVPHPETMGPLMTATAFAANGWIERARTVLKTAARGPAWDAAIEHRLFIDALLLIFEGETAAALARARTLAQLPLPTATPTLVDKVRVLRGAVAALARAFCHSGEEGDRSLLLQASDASPLVHWAMRYGAAILMVDRGDLQAARALLVGAPQWPTESCFSRFHHEISEELSRREQVPSSH